MGNWLKVLSQTAALGIAVLFVLFVIALAGASPIQVVQAILQGSLGSGEQLARTLATLAPLLLCSCGLVFSFTAGLYNLGIEGQITAGAIATTLMLRLLQDVMPPLPLWPIAILAGAIGGGLWGLLAATLNIYGRVNEIFAGLGLNFVADGLVLYLVFGPWKRAGSATISGTELLRENLHLPKWGTTELSPIALMIALAMLGVTIVVIRGTHFGLQLRAVGQNMRAAYVLGIPATECLLSAFVLCGVAAGLAGALQVLAVFYRLLPGISSNLGFLALLVVMLVNFDPLWILPVVFFFSALNVGGLQLPLSLNLESSLAGVIQGSLVLFALVGQGLGDSWRKRLELKKSVSRLPALP